MGKDNQDYFKRAGRSGGPPGPLRHFRQQYGMMRAELSREAEPGLPRPSISPPGPEPRLAEVESEAPLGASAGGPPPEASFEEPESEARPPAPGDEASLESSEPETQVEEPEPSRTPPEVREPGEWTGVPNGPTEMDFGPEPEEANGSASPEPGAEPSPGQSEFGPPASEEYIGPLPEPLAGLVRRFPRAFRLMARLGGGSARRVASMADRIERTIESGGR
nr:MAG: hypothetical protein DIU72_05725 [Pseudomonadota bacterium]